MRRREATFLFIFLCASISFGADLWTDLFAKRSFFSTRKTTLPLKSTQAIFLLTKSRRVITSASDLQACWLHVDTFCQLQSGTRSAIDLVSRSMALCQLRQGNMSIAGEAGKGISALLCAPLVIAHLFLVYRILLAAVAIFSLYSVHLLLKTANEGGECGRNLPVPTPSARLGSFQRG